MPPTRELLGIWLPVIALFLAISATLYGAFWFMRQRRHPLPKVAAAVVLLGFGGLCLYAIYPPPGDPLSVVPVLLLGLLALGLGGTLLWQMVFGHYCLVRRELSPALCEKCRYDLRSNRSGACPECGTPLSEQNRRLLTVREAERL